jgi:hypothetical protein
MNPPTFRRFLLATVTVMALFGPLSAWAETDGDWDFSYSDSDSTATITKYRGTSATPNVPSKVSRQAVSWEDGRGCTTNICTYTVTALGSVFSGNGNITSVSIPSTITELNGFFLCSNLVSISCSVPPTRIGSYAFVDCSRLKTGIDLSQCTYIGTHSFYNCQSLELGHLSLPNATNIDAQAFDSCQRLTSIELPSKLRYLGGGAFQRCQSLEWARIDGTDLDVSCLSGCANLQSVLLGDGVTSASSLSFGGCSSLRTLDVGSGLTVVSSNICKDLGNLESVTFRGNIQKIEEGAFSGCSNLVSVFFGGAPLVIGDAAFYNCRLMEGEIDLSQCSEMGRSAFYGCEAWGVGELELTKLAQVNDSAFYGCNGVTGVRFGEGLTNVGESAFAYCAGLSNVWFKGGVPEVGSGPFAGVASGARGHYEENHREEWTDVIGRDGKWQGLIMGEIPVPVLWVDSANPVAGSLTLAWEESAPLEGVTYSVWRGAGDSRLGAECVTNGLTANRWTDTNYWAAEPILSPLNYWVVAEGGGYGERESELVETRRKYALCVGVGRYKDRTWSTDLSDGTYANLFATLAKETFSDPIIVLTAKDATKATVTNKMRELAQKVKTGDYVFIFFSSHGKTSSWRSLAEQWGDFHSLLDFQGVAMYDTLEHDLSFENIYEPDEIKSDLERFFAGNNGINLAFLLNCCMSGGVVDCSPSNGTMAWITSCQETELTPTWTNAFGTPLPKFFFDYGWNQGRAWHGEYLTLADLADYAIPTVEVFLDKVEKSNTPVVRGEEILEHFIVGRPGAAAHTGLPAIPSGLEATSGKKQLSVSWNRNADTDCFLLRRTDPDGSRPLVYVISGEKTSGVDKNADWYGYPHFYNIAAMNEHGITSWSQSVAGSRKYNVALWISDLFGFDESTPPETLAAAAASPSANGMSYEACYVTCIDPNNPDAAFLAELCREGEKWKVQPVGGEQEGRVYRVFGKKSMTAGEDWTDVTDVEDVEAEGWRFFRVRVELAE